MNMANVIAGLRDAGFSDTQILDAIEKMHRREGEKRKAGGAERTRKWRAAQKERDAGDAGDNSDASPPSHNAKCDACDASPPSPASRAHDEVLPLLIEVDKKESKNIVQRAKSNGRHNFDSEFPGWYQRYPRHEAKEAARKAFNKARSSGTSLEVLNAGADRYAAQSIEPKYRKLPATWLNGGCWDDQHTPPINGNHEISSIYRNMPNFIHDPEEPAKT